MEPTPDDEHPAPPDPARGRRHLAVAAGVVLAEALALIGFAAWLLVSLFVDDAYDTRTAVTETVSFAVLGALLVLLARATHRGRRWSRGAVVTTQLFTFLGAALPLSRGELWGDLPYAWWVGPPLGLACVVATVAVLTPSTTAVLYADRTADDG